MRCVVISLPITAIKAAIPAIGKSFFIGFPPSLFFFIFFALNYNRSDNGYHNYNGSYNYDLQHISLPPSSFGFTSTIMAVAIYFFLLLMITAATTATTMTTTATIRIFSIFLTSLSIHSCFTEHPFDSSDNHLQGNKAATIQP